MTNNAKDILTDVLYTLRLRGSLFFRSYLADPWHAQFIESGIPVFHAILDGSCWMQHGDHKPVFLNKGHIAFVPRGDEHRAAHDMEFSSNAMPLDPTMQCMHMNVSREEATVRLLCGAIQIDTMVYHPLFLNLPSFIHHDHDHENSSWQLSAANLIDQELGKNNCSTPVMIDRIYELLLIQIIERQINQGDNHGTFLSSLSNPYVCKAIAAIHENTAHPWTVEKLASIAHLSRAAFAQHFQKNMGMGPIEYLTNWRIQKAINLLQTTDMSIAAVGQAVGYTNANSFCRTFKRITGNTANEFRQDT